MKKFEKLIPVPLQTLATGYLQNKIQLTPNRSGQQSKLMQGTQRLIKWMNESPLCDNRDWIELMYNILKKFKLGVVLHFCKLFKTISSTKMKEWKQGGAKIIILLTQIGWKINKDFKYDDFGFTGIESFIQNSLTGDEMNIKHQEPEQIEFGEVQIAIYRFLYKAISWVKSTGVKIQEKHGVKVDLAKPSQTIQQIESKFNLREFQEELIEYEQLKNDEDYIMKFLEKRMNCFEITFYKQIRNKEYRKFAEFFKDLIFRVKSPKTEENDSIQPLVKVSHLNQQFNDEDSTLTTMTKSTTIQTKQFKTKAVQTKLKVEDLKLEEIDLAEIMKQQTNNAPEDGEIAIEYKYFRMPLCKNEEKNCEVKIEQGTSKKQKLLNKRLIKEEQISGKIVKKVPRKKPQKGQCPKRKKTYQLQ